MACSLNDSHCKERSDKENGGKMRKRQPENLVKDYRLMDLFTNVGRLLHSLSESTLHRQNMPDHEYVWVGA